MAQISPDKIWQSTEAQLSTLLDRDILPFRPRKIHFYAPSFMYYKTRFYNCSPTDFPTISITGKSCALNCQHCGRRVLETMHPALTPRELFETCAQFKNEGAVGCLVSGGCLPNGSVPVAKFVDAIERVKKELHLTVFVHTGIIDLRTAEDLKNAGVDAALIDVLGSDETIREVYRLRVTVQDYENSLSALQEASIVYVPHIIVGLHHGKLKGELNALRMISKYNPSTLVIIAFMPIHGTPMAATKPPSPLDIAKVTASARLIFPQTPLVLGCMRPKGEHREETDVLAIKAGVNAIAFPTEKAVRFAEEREYETSFSPFCCAQMYSDAKTSAVSER